MKAIDALKAQYDAKGISKYKVPGSDLVIYASPLTMQEKGSIYKKSQAKGDETQYIVYLILEKALDKNGDKLFTLEDKKALLNACDADVIAGIGEWLLDAEVDHEKNS